MCVYVEALVRYLQSGTFTCMFQAHNMNIWHHSAICPDSKRATLHWAPSPTHPTVSWLLKHVLNSSVRSRSQYQTLRMKFQGSFTVGLQSVFPTQLSFCPSGQLTSASFICILYNIRYYFTGEPQEGLFNSMFFCLLYWDCFTLESYFL